MKNKLVTCLLVLIGIVALSGCQDFSEDSTPFEEGHLVTKNTTIDFWSATSAVDANGTAIQTLIEKFNKMQRDTYPDSAIRVVPSFSSGYDLQNTKLQGALLSNTNPDCAMVGVSSLALYEPNVINLERVFSQEMIDDMIVGNMQYSYYKDRLLGYPFWTATNAILVNRDMVNAAGALIPTPEEIVADPVNSTWTWDALEEALRVIKRETGKYGLGIANIPLYESMYSQGYPIYDRDASRALFNNEAGLNMLRYWQNIAKDDLIENPAINPNHGSAIQSQFMAGEIAMYYCSSSVGVSIFNGILDPSTGEPKFEVDVVPNPKVTDFYCNQNGGYYVIFSNKSDNRTKAAVEFLRWLNEPEQSAWHAINTGYIATTYSALETDLWKEYINVNPILNKVVTLMEFTPKEGLYLPMGRAKAIGDTEFGKYSKEIFLDNYKVTPEDALQNCFDRVDYVLRANSY